MKRNLRVSAYHDYIAVDLVDQKYNFVKTEVDMILD